MQEKNQLRSALTLRFKKIRGQILGVERMLVTKSADEIFIQLSAAKSALDKASLLVLENHMKSCLLGAHTKKGLDRQKENLIAFIRDYKYGSAHSVRYLPQNPNDLLQACEQRVGMVIDILEQFEESSCNTILQKTSEIRELLGRVGLILLEREIEASTLDEMSTEASDLENILHMAKKFII